MRIVLLGGTFNPPHNGHLRILKTAAEAVSADRVLMMPAGIPPHKSGAGVASGDDRLAMCRLAASTTCAEASDRELRRDGKSYTVLTLEELAAEYPQGDIYLTMGADMLVTLDRWYRYKDILKLCKIIAFYRSDTDPDTFSDAAERIRRDGGAVLLLPLEPDGISSTEIRDKIKNNQDVSAFLPEGVAEYIARHGLYKE